MLCGDAEQAESVLISLPQERCATLSVLSFNSPCAF
mgnify:FL=1